MKSSGGGAGRDGLARAEKQTSPHANSRGCPGPQSSPGSCANTATLMAAAEPWWRREVKGPRPASWDSVPCAG